MAVHRYPSHYDAHFQAQAELYFGEVLIDGNQVDWRWFKAQGIAESGLRPTAVSPAGAQGVMQIMPATAAEIGARLHLEADVFNPFTNIKFGVYYDLRMWRIWGREVGLERLMFMFASYNAGAGNILKAQKLAEPKDQWWAVAKELPRITGIRNSQETIGYVKRIFAEYAQLCEASA